MQVRAVVLDFDGTIAADQTGMQNPELIAVFKRLRKAGVKLVINTGRDLDYLIGPSGISNPEHVALFDAMIVECGGAVWYPGTSAPQPLTTLHSPELVAEMRRIKIPATEIWTGHAMIATFARHAKTVHRAIDRVNRRRAHAGYAPLVLDEIVNNSSATYLPPGVTKGSALLQVVAGVLGVPPSETLGGGDGANDVPFLSLCGAAIVPANANPRVKALGNAILTRGENAVGLVEVLTKVLDNGLRLDLPGRQGCAVA